jgi:hypothetical protein
MKTLKRTLALIAALTVVATTLAGCKDEKDDKSASSASTTAATTAAGGESTSEPATTDDGVVTPSTAVKPEDSAVKLASGGSKFTVAAWNINDFPALLAGFTGNMDKISASENAENVKLIEGAKTSTGAEVNFIVVGTGSGQSANDAYKLLLDAGDDLDLYAVEADFALNYINDPNTTAPLSDLGFKDSDWANAYKYTLEIGRDTSGVLRGISWQATPGAYAYRTDLAETYLGVKTPAEMQEKVKDWATMTESAKTVYEASSEKTAMCATIGGMWQVFSPSRDKAWVVDDALVADDPKTLAFLPMMREWVSNGYVTQVDQWAEGGVWPALGTNDGTMGFFTCPWAMGGTLMTAAAGGVGGKTYGKWGLVEGPQNFYWGGTWFVVNPKTDNGIDAKNFIYDLTIDVDTMSQYAKAKGEYMNNKEVMAKGTELANEEVTKNFNNQDYMAVFGEVAPTIAIDSKKLTRYDADVKALFLQVARDYAASDSMTEAEAIEKFKTEVGTNIPALG